MIDVEPLVDWLVAGASGAPRPDFVLQRLCDGLLAAGVPLDRAEVFVRTLHPHIAGRNFLWVPERKVEIQERTFAYLTSPAFTESPMSRACCTAEPVRVRLGGPDVPAALVSLRQEGYSDFVAMPMKFIDGQAHVVTFSTRVPAGFSDEHLRALQRVVTPLSRIAEIFALLRTSTNLLSTYVGRNAGARILGGQIQLGDTDTLSAVIWSSDLRGFTALTRTTAPPAVIRALNDLFGCQIPAIESRGGEVLKFIGDGLLAIFPFDPAAGPPRDRCSAALEAAFESFRALEAANASRVAAGEKAIAFGVALHLGEVSYGNIGGSNRLDFTCIGNAVNLAARLESVAAKVGRRLVVSEPFAKLVSHPMEPLGAFELKGVDVPQQACAPVLAQA